MFDMLSLADNIIIVAYVTLNLVSEGITKEYRIVIPRRTVKLTAFETPVEDHITKVKQYFALVLCANALTRDM